MPTRSYELRQHFSLYLFSFLLFSFGGKMVYTNRLAGNCFTNIRIFIELFFEKLFKKKLFLKNVQFKCFQFAFSPVVPLISFTSIRSSITSFYIPCSDTINRYMQVAIKYLWEEKRRKKFWLFHGWPSSSVDNFPGFILSSSHLLLLLL